MSSVVYGTDPRENRKEQFHWVFWWSKLTPGNVVVLNLHQVVQYRVHDGNPGNLGRSSYPEARRYWRFVRLTLDTVVL